MAQECGRARARARATFSGTHPSVRKVMVVPEATVFAVGLSRYTVVPLLAFDTYTC